ncbi:MAG: OmpA family protein [Eubacteriales bacterium]|nr:OmpA family protein [Eubacteriales bacterium]
MRRHSSGRTDSLVATNQGEQGFWPSYADMMSSLALILFFLMLISYIQNLITGNDLQSTQEVLADTQSQLALTQTQVKDAEDELALITVDLDKARLTLSQREAEISAKEDEITAQQALIAKQKDYMSSADAELTAMRDQMQSIAVLRLSILEQIRDSIVGVMGDASKVAIGDNGNIILSEGVFFDLGSSQIKAGSEPVLSQLVQVFGAFLSNSENAKYVDSIVISGHTDSTGTAAENRVLSTDRANSVLNYLLTAHNGALGAYSQYFCAAGYGATRPVADNGTDAGRAANRRIEISMILKDDTVLDIVDNYLNIELPNTEAAAPEVSPAPSASPSPTPAA